jgi:DNA polymerase I-like protein with 3'-5' exonuclease and polymerase domains
MLMVEPPKPKQDRYKVRSFIRAEEGKTLIACDLSQAETWIVGYDAREPKMIQELKYGDIHKRTASIIFEKDFSLITEIERYGGKRTNHATSYGMKPPRFAQVVNKESDQPPYLVISTAQARRFQNLWHGYYTQVKNEFWGGIQEQLKNNRTLENYYGFPRQFWGPWGDELFKEGYAFIPQSTVAAHFNGAEQYGNEIPGGMLEIKKRIIDTPSNRSGEIKIINQSHDSCMLEVPTGSARDILEEVGQLLYRPIIIKGEECWIPVDGEIGERWGEMEKVKLSYKRAA